LQFQVINAALHNRAFVCADHRLIAEARSGVGSGGAYTFRRGTSRAVEGFCRMRFYTEHEVAVAAKFMGYDLFRISDGYRLTRDLEREQEIIEADSLEMIADFLKP
jgi:hypothetical protein